MTFLAIDWVLGVDFGFEFDCLIARFCHVFTEKENKQKEIVGKGEREKKEWNYILGVTAHSQLMNDLKHQERRKQFKKGKHINNWGYHQIFCMCAQKKRKNEYLKRNFKWILIGKNEFIEMKIWYCWIINWSWFLLLNEKV